MAASLIGRTIERLTKSDDSKLSVADFCSGAGGPVPTIECLVNLKRIEKGQNPISFLLTDIKPHIDAWMAASAKSDYLSFIPQPVDATNPPVSVTSANAISTIEESTEAPNGRSRAGDGGNRGSHSAHGTSNTQPQDAFFSGTRIFRLYCLAFHHFSDTLARDVLKSTLATADGFAIVELQDRRLGSLLLMFLDFFLVFGASIFWFWKDPVQLLLTYLIPIIPPVMSFDGMVSSLRTREFKEVMALVDDVMGVDQDARITFEREDDEGKMILVAERKDWVFEGGREMHTYPIGYMNWVVAYKKIETSSSATP